MASIKQSFLKGFFITSSLASLALGSCAWAAPVNFTVTNDTGMSIAVQQVETRCIHKSSKTGIFDGKIHTFAAGQMTKNNVASAVTSGLCGAGNEGSFATIAIWPSDSLSKKREINLYLPVHTGADQHAFCSTGGVDGPGCANVTVGGTHYVPTVTFETGFFSRQLKKK